MSLAISKTGCGYNSRASSIRGRLVMATLRYLKLIVRLELGFIRDFFIAIFTIPGLYGAKLVTLFECK